VGVLQHGRGSGPPYRTKAIGTNTNASGRRESKIKAPLYGALPGFRLGGDEHYGMQLAGGYAVGRSRRSVTLTRISIAVSCQPIATPAMLDQNAIHNRIGIACSFGGRTG
jgi:hypothetical protein